MLGSRRLHPGGPSSEGAKTRANLRKSPKLQVILPIGRPLPDQTVGSLCYLSFFVKYLHEGYRWKKKLFSEQGRAQLEKLTLAPWASRRRQELLELLDRMNPTIEELTAAVEREARKRPAVQRLMTHPGMGPLTALAFVLIIGTWERFPRGKQIGNYVGMIPSEDSSAGKQRLGHISKQGNSLLRFLLVEAAQAAARVHPDWRRRYMHLAMRRHKSIAKVAMGRRLAIRLYWMWRNGCEYSQSLEFGSYAGQLGTGHKSGIFAVGLVLLDSLGLDLRGIPDPHLEPQLCQQSLEPT
jgi:transposase IS116/IS110/IS902 family protein